MVIKRETEEQKIEIRV